MKLPLFCIILIVIAGGICNPDFPKFLSIYKSIVAMKKAHCGYKIRIVHNDEQVLTTRIYAY